VTPVGAPGEPGVNDADGVLAAESPLAPTPWATTVKVYAAPLVRPVTVQVVVVPFGVVHCAPPGLAVTVYRAIPAPALAGAAQDTVTCRLPVTPVTLVGAPGGPGVIDADGRLAAEVPLAPTPFALTVTVYAVPLVRPLIVHVVAVPLGVVQVALPGLAVAV
jgi:hypothetical protein